jgi:hypothetical protein
MHHGKLDVNDLVFTQLAGNEEIVFRTENENILHVIPQFPGTSVFV